MNRLQHIFFSMIVCVSGFAYGAQLTKPHDSEFITTKPRITFPEDEARLRVLARGFLSYCVAKQMPGLFPEIKDVPGSRIARTIREMDALEARGVKLSVDELQALRDEAHGMFESCEQFAAEPVIKNKN